MIVPIILSGGSGTRLWPLSRELYPKQFLPLAGERTMLQETALRVADFAGAEAPLVVCNEAHRFLVAEQLRQVGVEPAAIMLEPCGRNTAPALAVAALQATAEGDDPLLLVLPADHLIGRPEVMAAALAVAAPMAEQGMLLTFGVLPTGPETGYGYIKAGEELAGGGEVSEVIPAVCRVERFIEKPDGPTAQQYLAAGGYFWNSGMFLLRASVWLAELERLAPDILQACRRAWEQAARDLDFIRLGVAEFAACPADSIDYAVMEKTDAAAVVPLPEAGWSDVGSWSSLLAVADHDQQGNACRGDVLVMDSRNCYLHADRRLLAAVGVEDLVVVETADAVLVAHRGRDQEVKAVVERLRAQNREELRLHRVVHRPWGTYEGLVQDERFQVKRITVKPGASLSLQQHYHRAEHWIVVKGSARITCDDQVMLLSENQSTYIPLGASHRLENPGKITLELIEVQSGSYLGEDDIVRLEDKYGR
ncbi:mannose-1-phosphate guanylyltransferase/mannose-6-phosphate isomerase [Desulfurivibrio alkaliphilus]|uniref:mannose-1-phosphate guanylyltransferase n=1 Tax=Desulfurivibrio alkaliphilus (strain DSM 19089 / UNIQEM U267 / AHT2) TaxID=589865 RepID=D6Z4F0_DESAT|nr:mannose-1-phosphate guanylyltransferase/mannose-6-phosphate isomerase [Desulfurivibrio alkaliphilus]ADH86425.1 mannose-1-phosphate guanylyltransferase/mannose-6-phosphate isomerase [Desulfurivibrio alkaliphilus AHT 2]